jgi:hypothetical protein
MAWTRGKGSQRIGDPRGDRARNVIMFVTDSREGMTCGAQESATGGGGNSIPIRKRGEMGRGPFMDPGRNVAGGPFSLFLFFFLFLL